MPNDTHHHDPEWVALASAAPEARKLLGLTDQRRDEGAEPTYRALYRAVLDGRLHHRRVNGRIELYRQSLVSFIGG